MNLYTGKHQRRFLLHIPEGYTVSASCIPSWWFCTARSVQHGKWRNGPDGVGLPTVRGSSSSIRRASGSWVSLQHWNAGHCCGKAVEDNWNDVAFIEAAIDGTCRQYAVDKRRIYMIGVLERGHDDLPVCGGAFIPAGGCCLGFRRHRQQGVAG
ncbi:MAG: hypothetical protein MZV70_24960 [Desulfobacterales bacterium]|nr:hypothetical protein [Desulfobacterales bacterium]